MVALRSSSSLLDSPHHRTGTRPRGGFRRLFASIGMRALGLATPGTAITEASNSSPLRIVGQVGGWMVVQISTHHVSSFTVRSSSGEVTVDLGASGAPREPAGCDE